DRHHPLRGFRHDAVRRCSDRGGAWLGGDAGDLPRGPADPGRADQCLRRDRQVSADRHPDVRPRGQRLRPHGRGAALGAVRHRPGRRRARGAGLGGGAGGHGDRRHLRLRPGHLRGGGPGGDALHGARRLSAVLRRQHGGRRRRDGHPDPAFHRLHRLRGAGAGRLRAGDLHGGDAAGHLGGARHHRAHRRHLHAAGLRRQGAGGGAAFGLAHLPRGAVGTDGAGCDPGRDAERRLHADRSGRDGGGLRAVRGLRGVPHPDPARPLRDAGGGGRTVRRDPHRHRAGVRLRLEHLDARHRAADRGRHHRPGPRRVRHHRAADAGADRDRDVPGRGFDLPDPAAGAHPHRQRLRVGPHLVRRGAHHEDRHRAVHPAAGRQPDGVLPHRRRDHGEHPALGGVDDPGDVRGAGAGGGLPGDRAVAAAGHGPGL
ncbi:MAG: TRAP-type C4-dicarboxylate transport system, large permease component, partial [uncultured Acetobacteraceae bacterium]